MPWWLVKQPNGKYARFSTVVDDFTHWNMTRAEALEATSQPVFWGYPRDEAEAEIADADAHPERLAEAIEARKCGEGAGKPLPWDDLARSRKGG